VGTQGSGTDSDGKLRRLPPGRHGLSREFVTRNQRERLVAGTIASVAERGYRETSVTQIAAAAGVSRRTFYSYFSTKEECFSDSFDLFESHLFEALESSRAEKRDWSAGVRAKITTLLDFLGANPDLVRFSLVAPPSAGGEIGERGRKFLLGLVEQLTAGHPKARGRSERTAVELEAMAGAIASILISRVESGSLDEGMPQLVELILAPFVGRSRAASAAEQAVPDGVTPNSSRM
jgi:AcrR family transcriptional regulator